MKSRHPNELPLSRARETRRLGSAAVVVRKKQGLDLRSKTGEGGRSKPRMSTVGFSLFNLTLLSSLSRASARQPEPSPGLHAYDAESQKSAQELWSALPL